MSRAILFLAGSCFVLAMVGASFAHEPPPGMKALKPVPAVRRAFSLVQHNGQAVTDRTFHGKTLLIFFAFATCTDVCPMGLSTMSQATKRLERSGIEVTPVFITVDPDRDTPALLANYLKDLHPRMVGLTGSRENISNAAAAFGVQFGVQKNAATYYVWHSSNMFLVGPRGELLATFAPYVTADAIVAGTRSAIAKPKPVARATIRE